MERKPGRYAAVILITVVGLLIAYPLSAGPAAWLATSTQSDTVGDVVETIYHPLMLLPEPLAAQFQNWVDLWLP